MFDGFIFVWNNNVSSCHRLFQKRCLDLMERMYRESMRDAVDLMDDETDVWGICSTPLTFAYENFMYDIVAHTCSQKNMSRKWYNDLPPDTWPFICVRFCLFRKV